MPWPGRDAKWPVDWDPIVPGELIQAGDGELSAVHTPGHAPDHLCFWDEEPRRCIAATSRRAAPRSGFRTICAATWPTTSTRSQRVVALRPVRLLPAHGPVIDDPEPLLRRYVEHRLARERQIVDVMREGATTADEITEMRLRRAVGEDAPDGEAGRAGASA